MRRCWAIVVGLVLVQVLVPSSAYAWWDFIEAFSGPRKFWGPDVQLRLFCLVETEKDVLTYVMPDPDPKNDEKKNPRAAVIQSTREFKPEMRSAVPVGVIVSLCKADPKKNERQRLAFDLGFRFMKSNHYEGDTNAFANGETIHFTTLEPAVMFPLVGKQDGLRLDYGFGAGVYWFSSKGFQSFHGAFLEPVRLDLRIPVSEQHWLRAVVARAGWLHFPAGFDPQAWGGSAGTSSRIGAEWVRTYSVFAEITPVAEDVAKRLGMR